MMKELVGTATRGEDGLVVREVVGKAAPGSMDAWIEYTCEVNGAPTVTDTIRDAAYVYVKNIELVAIEAGEDRMAALVDAVWDMVK